MSVCNDLEKTDVQQEQSVPQSVHPHSPATGGDAAGILKRWKREDFLKRSSLGLRGIALFFSLIAFNLVASNKHGDWMNFDLYQEYRYLLAIAILSSLYNGGQFFRQIHELSTRRNLLEPGLAALIDFVGDQVVAYLLISSASSAIPITDRMREGQDNSLTDASVAAIFMSIFAFTDASVAAICMSVFAFVSLALSAIISGYKLSAQTYI